MNYVPGKSYYYGNQQVVLNAVWFDNDKGWAAVRHANRVGFRQSDIVPLEKLETKKKINKTISLCIELKKDNSLEVTFQHNQHAPEETENFFQTTFQVEVENNEV